MKKNIFFLACVFFGGYNCGMKKCVIVLAAVAAVLFASCTEETTEYYNGKTQEEAYADFLACKESWTEPENYTFTYDYRFGDSDVGAEFITVVTDGVGVCTSNCAGDSSKAAFHFTSISELYDYFDGVFQDCLANRSADGDYYDYCSFSTKTVDGITYPYSISRSTGISGWCGYGGDSFFISDFSLENRTTFERKKAAWQEMDGAHSFRYSISLSAHGSNNQWSTGSVSVSVAADGTVSYEKSDEECYERFLSYFGTDSLFADGVLFPSVASLYDLIETAWNAEEEKADLYDNYAVQASLTMKDASGGTYPSFCELQSFFTDTYAGGSYSYDEDGEEIESVSADYHNDYVRFRVSITVN